MFPLPPGVDPSLGRLDYTSLSQQSLIELLVSGFDDIGVICGSHEALDEVEKWHGVSFGEGQNAQDIGKEKGYILSRLIWRLHPSTITSNAPVFNKRGFPEF
ncbi:hypothetical protein XU18_3797 [Perkinsela sp. CCAP 1560/4]|nr:hypothetical protein XU18_3797 [Perkinsela sp. CCAP 1560/4]|eukprot:KNH05069.1 hypothetical protein XU18_3797 [Perkinsela sp. CCAP 1560/4]